MTEVFEKQVAELNLDRSDWQLVKFGDVAIQQKQTVDRENTELTRYVKGEHMYSEDLHLRKWGKLTDEYLGPAFIRKFEEGDILYGSRRTYLRKVVIPPFEGITSNTTFVVKADEERIDKSLLPFIMLSEGFTQHSIKNSKGSVNPYINWKDIASYEFLLPPKEQHKNMSRLLWSIDQLIENEVNLLNKFNCFLLTELKEIFSDKKHKKPLITFCSENPKYGSNSKAVAFDGNIRYIRITDVGEFGFLNKDRVSSEVHEDKYLLKYGDFLIARSADPGRSYYYKDSDGLCSHAGYLIKFTLDTNKILPEFLYYFTHSAEYKAWIKQTTRKGTLSNINSQEFSSLKIPEVDLGLQKLAIYKITEIYNKLQNVQKRIEHSITLRKSLINQVF